MTTFAERLAELFAGDTQEEIGRKLGVTGRAAQNYLSGRVPDDDKLRKISEITDCNLHWLLTGRGEKFLSDLEQNVRNGGEIDSVVEKKVREILRGYGLIDKEDAGSEVGEIHPADMILAPNLGTVNGGDDEEENSRRTSIRKTG